MNHIHKHNSPQRRDINECRIQVLISNRSLFGMVICSPILDNISRPYRTYLSIDVCVNLYFVHMSFQYEWQSIPKKKIISSQESNQLTLCKAKSMHKNCTWKPLSFVIDSYMHWRATSRKSCEFESRSGEVYSVQHYVIKFVSNRSVVCSRYSGSLHLWHRQPRYSWTIV